MNMKGGQAAERRRGIVECDIVPWRSTIPRHADWAQDYSDFSSSRVPPPFQKWAY